MFAILLVLAVTMPNSVDDDVQGWVEILRDADPSFRAMAAKELGRMKSKAAAAAPHLVELLADKSATKKNSAAIVVTTVSDVASQALVSIGTDASPVLLKALKEHESTKTRAAVAFVLGELGRIGTDSGFQKDAAEALQEALADSGMSVRVSAIRSLRHFPTTGSRAFGSLAEFVQHAESVAVRYEAVQTIAAMKVDSSKAIPLLIDALGDPSPQVRAVVAESLGHLGDRAKDAVPKLEGLLDDDAYAGVALSVDVIGIRSVRAFAAEAIGRIGETPQTALTKLRNMMDSDKDPEARVSAALAVARTDPRSSKESIKYLAAALQKDGSGIAGPLAAAAALSGLGGKAESAVPELVLTLRHRDPLVRASAAEALATVAGEAAIPHLERLLKDESESVRDAAKDALERIRMQTDGGGSRSDGE